MIKSVTNKCTAYILYNKDNKHYYTTYYGGMIDYRWTDKLEEASQFGYDEALEIQKDMVCYHLEILKIEVKTTIKII